MNANFVRARTGAQRDVRRASIRQTAHDMLASGVRITDLSLNELARRVGLAKSNVLRYFDTREAVLLDLLTSEYDDWLRDVERTLEQRPQSEPAVERLSCVLAATVAERPVLAELLAASGLILENNLSIEVAATYKRDSHEQARRLAGILHANLRSLPEPALMPAVGGINLVIGGAWTTASPYPIISAVYETYPELAQERFPFGLIVRELIAVLLTGLIARPLSFEE